MQEEKIKEIISRYTKITADQVSHHTVIDRTAIAGSILLHRMYADLAKEGFEVAGYWDIKNYETLLHRLGANKTSNPDTPNVQLQASFIQKNAIAGDINPVGIDIEETGNMPVANDFREDRFYSMNFSPSEISYCILQPGPLVSFAGLFAAKEAMVKANSSYKNIPFNTIVIDHIPGGKPIHPDFYLSISHTPNLAVAVAIQKNINLPSPSITGGKLHPHATNTPLLYLVSFSAIILAIITFIIIMLRH